MKYKSIYSNVRWHIYKLQEVSKQLKALYYRQFILTIACFMFPARSAIQRKDLAFLGLEKVQAFRFLEL